MTTNPHANFNLTFMAARMAEAFQKIEITTTSGITDETDHI